jgi:hypothetical protein
MKVFGHSLIEMGADYFWLRRCEQWNVDRHIEHLLRALTIVGIGLS